MGAGYGLSDIWSSFWYVEASGLINMSGSEIHYGSDDSYGKTTTKMQTTSTFLEYGWDFIDETDSGTMDMQWILEGQEYPKLWWEFTV